MDGIINIENAKMEMMIAIMQIQKKYEMHSCIVELILSSCLSDIRECVNKDLIILIQNEENNEQKEG